LNVAQFNQCLDTGKYEDKVKQDFEEGQKYSVRGTPTFFINGTPQRARTFEQFAWHVTGGKEGKQTPSMGMAAAGGG
jgi:protein-disulfide isomerase